VVAVGPVELERLQGQQGQAVKEMTAVQR